jgi:integrase
MAKSNKGKRSRNGQGSIYETTFVDKRSGKKVTRWQAQVVIPQELGESKRRTLYGKTYAEVKEKLDALQRQVADGTVANTAETVAQYLERWLKETEGQVKARTAFDYRFSVEKYITPRIGSTRLEKLTPMKVQAMMTDIANTVSADRANKCRRVLFGALKQAVRWQLIPRNPVEAVDPMKHERAEMQLWTPAEAARFLDTAHAHRLYPLFYLAMSTGLRSCELLGLRWQDVQAHMLHIRQTVVKVGNRLVIETPKTKKGRRLVAVSPDVIDVLEQHRQRQQAEQEHLGTAWGGGELDHDLVFTSEVGTVLNPDNLRRLRNRLMDEAGVPRVKLHDLRHLHTSVCIKSGMNPKEVADRLGHSRPSFTLDVYTHLFEEQRANSAVSLLDFLPKAQPESLN